MLEDFDFKEPVCPLSGGKQHYYPDDTSPLGHIPIRRIIEKLDGCLEHNDTAQAERMLEYWRAEAVQLRDKDGELSIVNELIGLYRKANDEDKTFMCVNRALELVDALKQSGLVSGATVLLNCATAYKAFSQSEKAITFYESAKAVYEKQLDKNDPRLAGLYNNMALALVDLDNVMGAEAAYNKALDIMAGVKNGETDAAITYVNLAHMYDKYGKREKAENCLDCAIKKLQTPTLPKNGYYAFVLEKCAPSFEYFGKKELSQELMRLSKEIYERA